MATHSALLDQSINGAQSVLFNITHDGSLKLTELDHAARVIAEVVDPSANIIFGTVVDTRVGEEVQMTVIATGFIPQTSNNDKFRETRHTQDFGNIPADSEDADLPAFFRRGVRSMNTIATLNHVDEPAVVSRFAERR